MQQFNILPGSSVSHGKGGGACSSLGLDHLSSGVLLKKKKYLMFTLKGFKMKGNQNSNWHYK